MSWISLGADVKYVEWKCALAEYMEWREFWNIFTLCAYPGYARETVPSLNRNCACSIKAQSETVCIHLEGKFRKFDDLGKFEVQNNIIGGWSGTQTSLTNQFKPTILGHVYLKNRGIFTWFYRGSTRGRWPLPRDYQEHRQHFLTFFCSFVRDHRLRPRDSTWFCPCVSCDHSPSLSAFLTWHILRICSLLRLVMKGILTASVLII